MKRLIVVALMSAFALVTFGETLRLGPQTPPDPEKEHQRRLEKRAAKLKKTGGRIVDMSTMKGSFRFVNLQKQVPPESMEEIVGRLKQHFMSDFALVEGNGEFSVEGAQGLLEKNYATAGVFIIDMANLPTILIAPEGRWAMVNVWALSADGAEKPKLVRRVRRELLRAFAALAGGGGSMDPLCVSRTATTLAELDALKSNDLTYEPLVRAEEALKAMGITPYRRTTYREACEEGWAPAPTNDIQKAVWDQIKADKERGPTNPITIQPPSAKK